MKTYLNNFEHAKLCSNDTCCLLVKLERWFDIGIAYDEICKCDGKEYHCERHGQCLKTDCDDRWNRKMYTNKTMPTTTYS